MVRLALLVALVAGCLPKTYHCSTSADCGASGMCEPTGYCGYADPSCASGLRYGDLSSSYTGQCVTSEIDGGNPPRDARADAIPDAPTPFCDPSDPTLVGCWEFENDVLDASGHNNNGVATGVAYATGMVGKAAELTAASHIAVAPSTSLTPPQLTIEAWIYPTMLPGIGARMGILDQDGAYGLFIYPGQIDCFVSATVAATVSLPLSTWTHVACTYDGSNGIVYINGVQAAAAGGGTPLGAGNANGAALGGNSPSADTLVGRIDQYRVFSAPRTAAQICRAAGLTTCP
jgi:hypothetical protein